MHIHFLYWLHPTQKTVILWAVLHIPIVLALLLCISSLLSFLQWLYRYVQNEINSHIGFILTSIFVCLLSSRRLIFGIFGISVRKKEKRLRGSLLYSLENRDKTMAEVPKAICRIFRLAYRMHVSYLVVKTWARGLYDI